MRKSLLFLCLFTLVISCRKPDNSPPQIGAIQVNSITAEMIDVDPGDTLSVAAFIEDDIELAQFKIDIHHDFDGHSHKNLTTRYSEIRIKNISGTTYNISEDFIISDDASSGIYHGTIQVLDKEGNISEIKAFYFQVVRNNQPTIEMDLPESISSGSVLNVLGDLSAIGDATLSLVQIRIQSTKTGNDLLKQNYTPSGSPTTWNTYIDGNISVNIPVEENEKLIFRIRVEDSNGNNTIFETEIIIV